MNSYSLGISGSWILPIVLIIIAGVFTVYTYRYTVPPVSRFFRILLAALRSTALALLLFIIFEPVFTRISGSVVKPKIAVFVDNSISAGEQDAKINRRDAVRKAIENSGILKESPELLNTYLFDRDVFEVINFNSDSLKFKGQATDISKAIRRLIPNNDKNYRAGIIISDGAFNVGNNPLYDVNVLDKPLYVIGIGDSTQPKDLALQSIITNEIAYLDNPVPVSVNLKSSGFSEGQLKVRLLENGQQIGEQQLNISEAMQTFSVNFEYKPKQEGDQKLTATVEPIAGEITKKNNSYSEYVKVLKNKRKIAIFAGSPSPDVSFLHNTLKLEKGVEVQLFVQKKGATYYDKEPTPAILKDVEMYFLVGFPIASTSDGTMQMLKTELAAGKPIFYMSSSMISYPKLAQLEDYLPFKTLSGNAQEFAVVPDFVPTASAHPILRITGGDKDLDMWNTLPPLFRCEHYVTVKPESEKIAGAKINNTPLKDPLILTRVFQNQKSIAVLASGLYRWKLLGYAGEISKGNQEAIDLYQVFIQNSMRWLSVDQNNKSITIKTTKRNYTTGEKVGVVAQVYDAAYSPIDDAKVSVKISSKNQKRDVILNSMGNGRYYADVEGMPEGDYSFSGEVFKGANKLGEDKGRFSIGELALEYQNLSMNAPLLRDMAYRSGGKFYVPDNCTSILDDIKKHKTFVDRSITVRNEYALWSLAWVLGLVLLLLTIEWTIRKRLGMI